MSESTLIINEISTEVREAIPTWIENASIRSSQPEIVLRPWSFMLRYPLNSDDAILVKVARHEKMTLEEAVEEKDLLARTEREFEMLSKIAHVFQEKNETQEFCFVRPIEILPRWNALVMEELDAQPIKNYLLKPSIAFSSQKDWENFENLLQKSARWLREYHEGMGNLQKVPLSETGFSARIKAIFQRISAYPRIENIEKIKKDLLNEYDTLAEKKVMLAMLHGDFHCGNILVTPDGRIGALDADLTYDPIYQDLAKLFADLETRGIQMLSHGKFLRSRELNGAYIAITKSYFGDEEFNDKVLRLFIKVAILEKWLIDEDNLSRRAGTKSFAHKALSGWRRAYFSRLMQEQIL